MMSNGKISSGSTCLAAQKVYLNNLYSKVFNGNVPLCFPIFCNKEHFSQREIAGNHNLDSM